MENSFVLIRGPTAPRWPSGYDVYIDHLLLKYAGAVALL
jgi:hypothetical protein